MSASQDQNHMPDAVQQALHTLNDLVRDLSTHLSGSVDPDHAQQTFQKVIQSLEDTAQKFLQAAADHDQQTHALKQRAQEDSTQIDRLEDAVSKLKDDMVKVLAGQENIFEWHENSNTFLANIGEDVSNATMRIQEDMDMGFAALEADNHDMKITVSNWMENLGDQFRQHLPEPTTHQHAGPSAFNPDQPSQPNDTRISPHSTSVNKRKETSPLSNVSHAPPATPSFRSYLNISKRLQKTPKRHSTATTEDDGDIQLQSGSTPQSFRGRLSSGLGHFRNLTPTTRRIKRVFTPSHRRSTSSGNVLDVVGEDQESAMPSQSSRRFSTR